MTLEKKTGKLLLEDGGGRVNYKGAWGRRTKLLYFLTVVAFLLYVFVKLKVMEPAVVWDIKCSPKRLMC
jgi:hypothetical protein